MLIGYAVVADCARVLRDEACARLARAEAPPDLDVAGLDAALAVAGNLAGTWNALDPLGRRELTGPIWRSEMEAPRGRELNTLQTPLRALLTGDFGAYGRKSKGAVSCETAPFEYGDPNATRIELWQRGWRPCTACGRRSWGPDEQRHTSGVRTRLRRAGTAG